MDYKEKYTREEALREVRGFMWQLTEGCQAAIKALVPELAESEDERVRKNCIHFLEYQKSHHADTREIEECISWLEKQEELKMPEEKFKHPLYVEGFEAGKQIGAQYEAVFGKQKEQWIPTDKQRYALGMVIKHSNPDDESTKVLESLLDDLTKIANPKVAKWKEQRKEKQKEQNLLPGFEMTGEEIMDHPLFLEGFDVGRDVGHIEAEQKRVILDNPLTGEACYEVEIREYMKGADPDEMAAVLLLTKKGWTVIAPGHEQKPAEWSDSFEEAVADLIERAKQGKCDSLSPIEEGNKLLAIAKHGKVNQQEWSEEDEKIRQSLLRDYEYAMQSSGTVWGKDFEKKHNWLKSLRPQPKQEWSGVDNLRLHQTIDVCDRNGYPVLSKWLKGLLCRITPQSSWKPSEEQMEALKRCVDGWPDNADGRLESLFNDLKKLTNESTR